MIVTHKIEMDIERRDAMPKMDAVQGDSNTRVIELSLFSDGAAWPVPDGVTAAVRYCKPDGTKGVYDTLPDGSRAWSAEGNEITVTLAPQMLTVDGAVFAQIEMSRDTDVLATFTIQVNVAGNPAAGALESEDYINWLHWMERELAKFLQEAKESGEFNGPRGIPGPQGPAVPIDSTLSVSGQAADAAAVGNGLKEKLSLSGGRMTGDLAMGGNKVSGLGTPTAAGDAAPKSYVDGKHMTASSTIRASAWTGSAAPYTQTVTVAGILASDLPHIAPVYSDTLATALAQKEAWAMVSEADAGAGKITFTCFEGKPAADIPVQIEVTR